MFGLKTAGLFDTLTRYGLQFLAIYVSYAINNLICQFARGIDDVKGVAFSGVVGTVTMIALNLIFLLWLHLGLQGYFYAMSASLLFPAVFLFIKDKMWQYVDLKSVGVAIRDNEKEMLQYCLPLVFINVELLLNSVERCIAIRPCDKNNPNAIRWGRLKEGRWCASTLGCRGLAKTLFDIMEWDEDLRYRFRGQFLEQGDNKMMLFAFDEPEMIKVEEIVLPPKENTEEDEGETVKKKIYIFPPEWAGTFGQPITSIAQVGILRQEHYAGNWDVFRPATEIEEMNIFTAESLNELLREAEKIMEGWTDYR